MALRGLVWQVDLILTAELLGTVPLSKDQYETFVAADVEEEDLEEELAAIAEEAGWTGFLTDAEGRPFLLSHMVKGFFKEACGALRRTDKSLGYRSPKITAYKRVISTTVFVYPRRLLLRLADPSPSVGLVYAKEDSSTGLGIGRPLRAQTPKGERTSLARSHAAPVGTTLTCYVASLGAGVDEKMLCEWLDFGALHGLGQWRNSAWGTFEYTLTALGAHDLPFDPDALK